MISRRRFLWISAASATGMLHDTSIFAAQNGLLSGECFLIGDGDRGDASLLGASAYSSRPGKVKIWQFKQNKVHEIPLPFLPHSFVSHPAKPHQVITFEKWGQHIAEIDLADMAVVRITTAESGRRFFGHGAHAGTVFYATQMDDVNQRGIVSVIDSGSHKIVQEFDTQGAFPHDCQWLAESNVLLIVNSRRSGSRKSPADNSSSLAWLDAGTGKCVKQVFIKTKEFGYAHLAQSRQGFIVLSGSYNLRNGGSQPLLAIIHPDGSVQPLDVAALTRGSVQGEVLSLYLDEVEGHVTATLPNSSKVQVWDYQKGQLVRQINIREPRGLVYSNDKQALLVSSGQINRS